MLITNIFLYDLLGICAALLIVIISYCKWSFSYWKKKGLEGIEPSIPFGNITSVFLGKKPHFEAWRSIYLKLKSKGLRHGGLYISVKPVYMPVDLGLLKNIMMTDFNYFYSRGLYVNPEVDPFTANVFSLYGPRWKSIRSKLTPTFSSGRIKTMFGTVLETSSVLKDVLTEASKEDDATDIGRIFERYLIDIIVSVGYGIECNALKNPEAEFYRYLPKLANGDFQGRIKLFLCEVLPKSLLSFLKVKICSEEASNFFTNSIQEIVNFRENNNISRNDFMQLLLRLKNKGSVDEGESATSDKMTFDEILAQCFTFLLAGADTTSVTLTFAIYEMAANPDLQDRLRKDINDVLEKHGKETTFEAIMEMTYLDKFVCETLRKYPAAPIVTRECVKKYQVPGTDVVIDEGTFVIIPIMGIHRDPDFYPDPEKFDPERFSQENKAKRPSCSWLPFGDGPKNCIGLRFAMMVIKATLVIILQNFKIRLNKKTKKNLKLRNRGSVITFDSNVWVNLDIIN